MLRVNTLSGFGRIIPAAGGGVLADDFEDASINTSLWDVTTPLFTYDAAVTVVESGGVLTITPRTSHASSAYNGVTSDATYNFTDSFISVEVPTVISSDAGTDMRLVLFLDVSNYIDIHKTANNLAMRVRVAAVNSEETATWSGTSHRWWRIRHQTSGGHIYFDTAPDGSTWTNRRDYTSSLFTITALKVALIAGTFSSVAAPGTAAFDNLLSDL